MQPQTVLVPIPREPKEEYACVLRGPGGWLCQSVASTHFNAAKAIVSLTFKPRCRGVYTAHLFASSSPEMLVCSVTVGDADRARLGAVSSAPFTSEATEIANKLIMANVHREFGEERGDENYAAIPADLPTARARPTDLQEMKAMRRAKSVETSGPAPLRAPASQPRCTTCRQPIAPGYECDVAGAVYCKADFPTALRAFQRSRSLQPPRSLADPDDRFFDFADLLLGDVKRAQRLFRSSPAYYQGAIEAADCPRLLVELVSMKGLGPVPGETLDYVLQQGGVSDHEAVYERQFLRLFSMLLHVVQNGSLEGHASRNPKARSRTTQPGTYARTTRSDDPEIFVPRPVVRPIGRTVRSVTAMPPSRPTSTPPASSFVPAVSRISPSPPARLPSVPSASALSPLVSDLERLAAASPEAPPTPRVAAAPTTLPTAAPPQETRPGAGPGAGVGKGDGSRDDLWRRESSGEGRRSSARQGTPDARSPSEEPADAPWLSDLLDGTFQQRVMRSDTVAEKTAKKVKRPPGSRPVGPAQAAASVSISAALY